jgi:beta-glucanase (GH16 family)
MTSSTNNLAEDGNGNLVITALHQPGFACPGGTTNDYTSGRLETSGKVEHTYGFWQARIKLPSTQGTFPAFWHLGNNTNNCGASPWPSCGEVDTIENIGKEPSTSHSGIHGPGYTNGLGCSYTLSSGVFDTDYHIFSVDWEVNSFTFYVDGNVCGSVTSANIPSGTTWIFNSPKQLDILFDFAIGGVWAGNPDSTSVFPQHMVIDYVRIFDAAF